MDRRLVDHLVNSKIVSRAAMQRIILRATKDKTGVVEQLLDDEKVNEEAVARELAAYFSLETIDPAEFSVNETVLKFISKAMADKHGVLPFAVSDSADHVTVAVYNPEAAQSVVESLKTATGKAPTVKVAPRTWLTQAIRHFYFGDAWSAAPAHRAATREVTAVAQELGLGDESSSEIVLDEVVVPPAPRPRKPSPAKSNGEQKTAPPTPEPAPPRRRKNSDAAAEPKRKGERPAQDSEAEVEAALDDFDTFLDSATGWGKAGSRSGIPGWDEAPPERDANPFAREEVSWQEPSGTSGFSLFDEKPDEDDGLGLRDLVDMHESTIEQLRRELQQQREIISALVEALADAGVVSKRDIKQRVKRR